MAKESAVMYRSFLEATRELDPEKRLQAIDAYFDYVMDGKEYEGSDPVIKALLIVIKPALDKASNRYDAACENGKKGGRPKTRTKPEQNQNETSSKPEQNLNVYVDVYEDVDVNEDVNVNDNDEKENKAKEKSVPLDASVIKAIKEKVVEEGDLSYLARDTWITPARIERGKTAIHVKSGNDMAAIHIRDRYGGYFANAIRSVIPDFEGNIVYE